MYRFREAREACDMQQKGVALALGVSVQSVSFWENGKRMPSYENITKLAKLYGVSVDYLLGNDKQEGEPEGKPAEDKELEELVYMLKKMPKEDRGKVAEYARFVNRK